MIRSLFVGLAGVALGAAPLAAQSAVREPQIRERAERLAAELSVRAGTFEFLAAEPLGGKVVKGAPYSAEAVTETVQVLADGNRIVNRSSSNIYRDSEGRERREQTLDAFGPVKTAKPVKTVSIWDPVAKVGYSLDERTKTARRSPVRISSANGAMAGGLVSAFSSSSPGVRVITGDSPDVMTTIPVPPPASGESLTIHYSNSVISTGGNLVNSDRMRKEDLGERVIEGVKAQGTRTTIVIPAGEIGNERPIETVSERWYSPELQTTVMTRRSDPRTGETTYKLTLVNRSEPPRTLFEVPPDYEIAGREIWSDNPSIIKRKQPEEI